MKRTWLSALAFMLLAAGLTPAAWGAPIGERAIKDAIKKHIEENAVWPKDRIRVEFLGHIPEAAAAIDASACEIRSRSGEAYIGRTAFTVRFCKGDTFLREETIRVRIEVFADVIVTTQGIARDALIGASDVTQTRKWLDTVSTGLATDLRDVIGKKAGMRLNAGTEVTKQMLRSIPVVKKGEVVRILLESGPMTISAVGLSQEDGGQGDLIRVQNIASNKIVFARVTGPSLVQVEF